MERWDARNQESAEFANEMAPSLENDHSGRALVLAWLGMSVGGFLLVAILRAAGMTRSDADLVRMVVLGVVTVGAFIVLVVQTRRRRREWRAKRQGSGTSSAPRGAGSGVR